jgi:hypothetical protein
MRRHTRGRMWLGAPVIVIVMGGMLGGGETTATAAPKTNEGKNHSEAPADYDITLANGAAATAGDRGAVSLTITPRPGLTISSKGPLIVDLSVAPAEGIGLPRRRYQRRDAADVRAGAPRFDLRYHAAEPGEYAMRVSLLFWVCGRHSCWPVRTERTVPIAVAPGAAPPG